MAENAEAFILISNEDKSEDVLQNQYHHWRIVNGEQRSINLQLANVQPHYMGKQKPIWSLLQYCLFRVDSVLDGLSLKFLEQGSYTLTTEEMEKLQAVITIYKKIHEKVELRTEQPVLVVYELTDLMFLIDPNYSYVMDLRKDNIE